MAFCYTLISDLLTITPFIKNDNIAGMLNNFAFYATVKI